MISQYVLQQSKTCISVGKLFCTVALDHILPSELSCVLFCGIQNIFKLIWHHTAQPAM